MIVTMLGLWLALLIAGDTPAGRWMHRAMVAAPAERLARFGRGDSLLLLLMLTAAVAVAWIMADDGMRLLGWAAPEVIGWASAFEVSAYLDALAAVVLTASTLRVSAVRLWIGGRRRPARNRARRPRRPRRLLPSNDDDDPGDAVLAA